MKSTEEKTEAATPKQKKEAIQKGQVAKSQDINSALILLAGVLLLLFLGGSMIFHMKDTMGMVCKNLFYEDFDADTFVSLIMNISMKNLKGVLPILGGFMIVGLIASYSQVGLVFSRKALIPDFKRLNPISGAQKLFSKRSLVKTAMALLKLSIMGGIAFISIKNDLEPLMELLSMRTEAIFTSASGLVFGITLKISIILLILALLDFLYQRWQHSKDLMMTKNEVKQEAKQTDGDPMIKARIKNVQREMSRKRMMQAIPEADVVVTNPTHYAVALKYDAATMDAPKVIGKGVDLIALKIREVAAKHDIPIVEDRILARVLYSSIEINSDVPPKLYQAVAKVLSYVYQLRNIVANR
ncbi:flagellar biosynthetic protein FlhB [Candidatus Scalindua japonica]|uniref:Flagellar biosynthetic protein FlhB n=1 Tax=Candidatus Scalindua japonica TaxID=1284222 RepID=A0A286TVW8_9BACT|nr:flagellar biosynthesis protein FlhB [Candidatus Scalindua japonica]GAX60032.1 flagellar biosynthetic protein FlhB [Candidatus Scalindua japonica]